MTTAMKHFIVFALFVLIMQAVLPDVMRPGIKMFAITLVAISGIMVLIED